MGFLSRHLRLVFLVTALVVAAFSTGLPFLFFLVYLTAAILIGSWLYARRGLTGVRADYRVLNPRTHVGEVLQAVYRVENHDWLGKPWIELWNESTLPSSLPGRVVGLAAQGRRQWLAKVTLTRRGSYPLGAPRGWGGGPVAPFSPGECSSAPPPAWSSPRGSPPCRPGVCPPRRWRARPARAADMRRPRRS